MIKTIQLSELQARIILGGINVAHDEGQSGMDSDFVKENFEKVQTEEKALLKSIFQAYPEVRGDFSWLMEEQDHLDFLKETE